MSGVAGPHTSGGSAGAGPAIPVLVVEDDADTRALLVEIFTEDGYAVHAVADGAAALAVAERVAARLIVLDMRLPVMDGWHFARAYRALPGPHAPLLVLTGARDPVEWAEEIGGAVCFPKPFDVARLRAVARRLVGRGAAPTRTEGVEGTDGDVGEEAAHEVEPFLGDLAALLLERQELVTQISAAEREPKELTARLERNLSRSGALLSQIQALVPPEHAALATPRS